MTSILEPFLSKRSPNETGTVSVYASVNRPAENNADSFFQADGGTITTSYNINAPEMTVSQITSDDSVVNKSYVDGAAAELTQSIEESYIRKDTTSLALQELDITDTRKANSFNFNEVKYTTDDVSNSYLEISHNGQRFVCMNKAADRGVNFINDIGLGATYFIRFNRRIDGVMSNINYPEGALCNLIPSTITSAQINYLTGKELLDNVCPTYKYCEDTYAKSSELTSLVVQETGDSTTSVMSQKAVTDLISPLSNFRNISIVNTSVSQIDIIFNTPLDPNGNPDSDVKRVYLDNPDIEFTDLPDNFTMFFATIKIEFGLRTSGGVEYAREFIDNIEVFLYPSDSSSIPDTKYGIVNYFQGTYITAYDSYTVIPYVFNISTTSQGIKKHLKCSLRTKSTDARTINLSRISLDTKYAYVL